MANFEILNEVSRGKENDWKLCFQYGCYHYDDGSQEFGYRFIWRYPDGKLCAARGQARIPSIDDIEYLTGAALFEGWGKHNDGSLSKRI